MMIPESQKREFCEALTKLCTEFRITLHVNIHEQIVLDRMTAFGEFKADVSDALEWVTTEII